MERPSVDELRQRLISLTEATLKVAPDVTMLFVTNLREGQVRDIGPEGIDNGAQAYSRQQADEIIRSLQGLGLTVYPYFSEVEFIRAVVEGDHVDRRPHHIVFTTAEGGVGSGRRALIPAFCNLVGLPVLNSGPHSCSLACHKFHANAVLRQAGVRVPESWMLTNEGWLGGRRPTHGSRVIVKPSYESMSIGVADDSVVWVDESFDDFVTAKLELFRQDTVVQEFVTGEELGVPLIRLNRTYALPPIAFRRANGDTYGSQPRTFAAENLDRDTSMTAFNGSRIEVEAVQSAAIAAFDALQMRGVGRIDVRVDADGRSWVFDTNIAPPPLSNTSFAASMGELRLGLREMLAVWLGACLLDHGLISGV